MLENPVFAGGDNGRVVFEDQGPRQRCKHFRRTLTNYPLRIGTGETARKRQGPSPLGSTGAAGASRLFGRRGPGQRLLRFTPSLEGPGGRGFGGTRGATHPVQ